MTTTTHRGAQPNIAQSEPVTIGGGILALGSLIIGGLPLFTDALSAEQVGYLNLVFAAIVALATAIIRHFTVAKAKVDQEFTHNENVVEKIEDHQVVAGEGSELPTGTHVREAGDLQYNPEDGSSGPEPDAEV